MNACFTVVVYAILCAFALGKANGQPCTNSEVALELLEAPRNNQTLDLLHQRFEGEPYLWVIQFDLLPNPVARRWRHPIFCSQSRLLLSNGMLSSFWWSNLLWPTSDDVELWSRGCNITTSQAVEIACRMPDLLSSGQYPDECSEDMFCYVYEDAALMMITPYTFVAIAVDCVLVLLLCRLSYATRDCEIADVFPRTRDKKAGLLLALPSLAIVGCFILSTAASAGGLVVIGLLITAIIQNAMARWAVRALIMISLLFIESYGAQHHFPATMLQAAGLWSPLLILLAAGAVAELNLERSNPPEEIDLSFSVTVLVLIIRTIFWNGVAANRDSYTMALHVHGPLIGVMLCYALLLLRLFILPPSDTSLPDQVHNLTERAQHTARTLDQAPLDNVLAIGGLPRRSVLNVLFTNVVCRTTADWAYVYYVPLVAASWLYLAVVFRWFKSWTLLPVIILVLYIMACGPMYYYRQATMRTSRSAPTCSTSIRRWKMLIDMNCRKW